MPAVSDRITCPYTGKRGKVVFVSPVNERIYVEYDRELPFVTYPKSAFKVTDDLFGDL